ncbi:MAG: ATP-grasp domain-containing protein [Actinomycetota bacterium]|nr:ATP-grasp domain-containing protein [Actinomycetota bacterium]MDQ2956411.1 ATP-grasp domain-containing protein [Actinomycetota bacterium]
MARLAILFDEDTPNAADIALGAGKLAELSFVCTISDHPVLELLAELGEVIDIDAGTERIAESLSCAGTNGIVTFSDGMLQQAAELASRLGLPFHSKETVRLVTDKSAQRARLRACGVDEVRTSTLHTAADWPAAVLAVGLPAVLKPASGSGSRDTYLIRDPRDGLRLAQRLLGDLGAPGGGPFVLEEYLIGKPGLPFADYISVESVVSPAGIAHVGVTGNFPMVPPFREIGHFWPSVLAPHERRQVEELTTRALQALGISWGLTHTELKLTPDGPRIIEVNGRLGGFISDLARSACGLDLVEVASRIALGWELPELPSLPDRVHFQYSSPMPAEACTLRGVRGVPQLRKTPGITGYRSLLAHDIEAAASVMTRRIDMVFGTAADHQEMLAVLDAALPNLRYDFSMETGDCELTAADLIDLARQTPVA